jgi:hypothetical protein
MIIYGVCIGNDYEGHSISNPLFRLKSDAMMECNARANKYNDERGDNYQLQNNDAYDNGWWRDEYNYIHVIEYELI